LPLLRRQVELVDLEYLDSLLGHGQEKNFPNSRRPKFMADSQQ
jgi:hypothetical protein